MSMTQVAPAPPEARQAEPKRMNVFDRYLTVWVALCMAAGMILGRTATGLIERLRGLEFGAGSQINAPIAVLIWLMIVPMMMKIDFTSLVGVTRRSRGLLVTLFVNWLVKPFSMFLLGWLFFQGLFLPLIGEELARQYTAGVIILAAAPCTAMVFVWSYLTDGDPAYTLVQVAVNDLIMLVLFPPSSACWWACPVWPFPLTSCSRRWLCSSSYRCWSVSWPGGR